MASRPRRRRKPHSFRSRLSSLGFATYEDYLRSPHWVALRDAFWKGDDPKTCFCCGGGGRHLHHVTYARIGAEEPDDLVLLCARCHLDVHALCRDERIGLAKAHHLLAERVAAGEPRVVKLPPAPPKPKKKRKKLKAPKLPKSGTYQPPRRARALGAENDKLHAVQVRNRERQAAARAARAPRVVVERREPPVV